MLYVQIAARMAHPRCCAVEPRAQLSLGSKTPLTGGNPYVNLSPVIVLDVFEQLAEAFSRPQRAGVLVLAMQRQGAGRFRWGFGLVRADRKKPPPSYDGVDLAERPS